MGSLASHWIFAIFHRGDACIDIYQRVVGHHALVHTVERDVVAVRREVLALFDAPLAAVYGFTEDDVLARVGAEQDGLVIVFSTSNIDVAVIFANNKQAVLDGAVEGIGHGNLFHIQFAVVEGDNAMFSRDIELVFTNPLVARKSFDVATQCRGNLRQRAEDGGFRRFSISNH